MPKVCALARLNKVDFADPASGNLLRGVWRLGEFGLDVHGAINVGAERDRMQKEMGRVQQEIDKTLKKINSPDFLARAPEEVVSENRARHGELLDRLRKLELNLKRLPIE
jgi:valyl-tRNA synthetase